MVIELGGNIKLEGFSDLDPTTMIIVKKLVGNIAREFQEKESFNELLLTLTKGENTATVQASLKGKKELSAEATEANLFFAINNALAHIKQQY